MMFLITSC